MQLFYISLAKLFDNKVKMKYSGEIMLIIFLVLLFAIPMVLITNRTNENATIKIDYSNCNNCGLCSKVCKDQTLLVIDKKLIINTDPLFGCIGCGQCVAICPYDAISIDGRTLTMEDFVTIPPKENRAGYNELFPLLLSRRSVRDFKNKES